MHNVSVRGYEFFDTITVPHEDIPGEQVLAPAHPVPGAPEPLASLAELRSKKGTMVLLTTVMEAEDSSSLARTRTKVLQAGTEMHTPCELRKARKI
jgi:hypothetical protein